MSNSTKKGFGVYATLVSAVLAIAAAVIYQVIGGKFGATQRVCYDQWVVLLLIGGGVVSGALVGSTAWRARLPRLRRLPLSASLRTSATGMLPTCLWRLTKRALTRISSGLPDWRWARSSSAKSLCTLAKRRLCNPSLHPHGRSLLRLF